MTPTTPMISEHLAALGLPPDAKVTSFGNRLISIEPKQSRLITRVVAAAVAGEYDSAPDVLRAIRDTLIGATDWTQTDDAPLSGSQQAAWAAYRQALRDLPSVYSGAGPIPWPTAP
jgi:hypothetical protein